VARPIDDIPSETRVRNGGQQGAENETTPPEQRVAGLKSEVGKGPVVGTAGEYKPAAYKKTRKNRSFIREDR
jgi:hypothetical protein